MKRLRRAALALPKSRSAQAKDPAFGAARRWCQDCAVTGIGTPGSPDGPSPERAATGKLVVTFHDAGPPSIEWPTIPDRTHRQVVGDATKALVDLLNDTTLDKLGGEPPKEPPL